MKAPETQDPRIGRILGLIQQLRSGNLNARETPTERDDDLDEIIVGLNALAKQFSAQLAPQTETEKWLNAIMEVIVAIASLDYTQKAPVSDEGNVFDAIGTGLNALSEELRASTVSRDYLDSIINSIGDAVIATDAEGNVTRLNPVAEELTGWNFEEAQGKHLNEVFKIVNAQTGETAVNPVTQVLESGKIVGLANHTMLIAKDGTEYQIADSAAPIRNTDGSITGVALVFQDVTEDYQVRASLQESEEQYRTLLEHLPISVFTKNRKGEYTSSNAENQKYWATSPIGRTDAELLDHETATGLQEADFRVMATGDMLTLEERIANTPFGDRQFWTRKVPLRNSDGNMMGILGVSIDITERVQAVEALRQSEERLSKFINSAGNSYHILDADLTILEINRGALEAIYLADPTINSKKDVIGQDFERIYPFLRDEIPHFAQVIKTGVNYVNELTVPHPKLDDLVISSVCFKVGDGLGVIAENITERRHAEEALRESESRARALLEAIPDMMFRMDGRGVHLDYMAEKSSLYDQTEKTIIGKINRDITPPDFADLVEQKIKQTLDSGEMQTFEYQLPIPGGGTVDFEARMVKSGEDEVIAIVRDVTQRKQTEESLRQLSQAIEQSPATVMITDTEGVIQYTNPKFTQVAGYSAAEAIGQNPRFLQSGEHPPEFYREMWATITAGQEWRGEFRNKKKNGDLYWEQTSITGVKDQGGKITHYVAVKEDITQRKQREEEHVRQERLVAVGHLAAGIAHDFNNVMGVITLYSDLLQRTADLSENDLKKVQIIHEQANHAADLTQQILDFSRRSVLEPRLLDLKLLLEEMLKFIERTIPERIQVQSTFLPGDYTVNADPTQLRQAITNLTVNARDAMPRTGALDFHLSRMTLHADESPPCPDMEPGTWVKLTIADTGDGISPEALPQIFEPFFSTKEVGQGTGLGLAQVYGIVRQHKGCITVESRLGQGTAFAIYLPALVEETSDQTASPTAASPTAASPQGQGETILLVEDNQILLEATRSTLESLNYRVLTAEDGEEALNAYRAQPDQISLIVADVVMPKMDGFELVKALHKQSTPPKVLLMSGFPRDMEIPSGLKQQILGWLPKPINLRQLAVSLREALN